MPENVALLDLNIVRREEQTPDIISLDLVAADGRPLPPFEAGAHIDLHIAPGLIRQYSLCGDPAVPHHYRLGILLDPASRGGSRTIHRDFQPGTKIHASLPRNHFPLAADATFSLLVGGGIGITPLIAMAHQLAADGAPFALHYCTRSRESSAFIDELRGSAFWSQVCVHYDDGPEQDRFSPEHDLPTPSSGTHIYVCGPTGFMDWVIAGARARHYPDAAIHREYFAADVDASGGPFEVVLATSGLTVAVNEGQSIVGALASAGVHVPVSCEEGVCGTCLTQVLEGVPDHRDVYLTDEEKKANDQILLCCSRAKTSRLVIDL
jgi:ferredoxin-NADP reductase